MSSFSARRLASAFAVSAAAFAALAAPGTASAFKNPTCDGTTIGGQGSSLQKVVQTTVWGPNFNSSVCFGDNSQIATYNPSGSGKGLESWGSGGAKVGAYGPTNAYVGTDQPPNAVQREEIEVGDNTKTVTHSLLTIPVLQESIAIIVHLPKGCKATSTVAPGRLALKSTTLEAIFEGKTKEWKLIKDFGDKFENAGSETCPIIVKKAKVLIGRVVRSDGSGTTATFKKYLFLAKKPVLPTDPPLAKDETWNELAEENPNTVWPNETTDPVTKVAKGSGIVTAVEGAENSIGYVSLSEVRVSAFTEAPGTGGPGTTEFWTPIQNGTGTVADPSVNGPSNTPSNANCEDTKYTNGKKKFPPPTSTELWNEVNSSLKETNYTICGFTYDLSLEHFGEFPGTSEEEAQTVSEYFGYELGGGQSAILNKDYLPLPTSSEPKQNVLKIAQEGQAKINE
jgi:ABC-type phosphate transport system substrate-binding protein